MIDLDSIPREQIPAVIAALAARLLVETMPSTARQPDGRDKLLAVEPLLDARAMAQRLGVAESRVRTLQRAGQIPHVPVGRYIRFRPSAVEAALAAVAKP